MKNLVLIWLLIVLIIPLTAQESEEPTARKIANFGAGIRVGYFGIPNPLLDLFLYEHPNLSGSSFAFELRSFGAKGPKSVFSGVYSFEYSTMEGAGPWRINQDDRRLDATGEISQLSLTATVVLNVFPMFPVNPYIGAGIGVGRIQISAQGSYKDELGTEIKDTYLTSRFIPIGHIPVGVRFNIKDKVEIRVEGGFKNGFYFGGGLVYIF